MTPLNAVALEKRIVVRIGRFGACTVLEEQSARLSLHMGAELLSHKKALDVEGIGGWMKAWAHIIETGRDAASGLCAHFDVGLAVADQVDSQHRINSIERIAIRDLVRAVICVAITKTGIKTLDHEELPGGTQREDCRWRRIRWQRRWRNWSDQRDRNERNIFHLLLIQIVVRGF